MLNRGLDSWVGASHRIRLFGRKYHPYFIASDVATALCLAMAWRFCARFEGVVFWRFLVIFALIRILYRLALKAKATWLGSRSRSLLQDTVFFLLPLYAGLNYAFGHSLVAAFDLLALFLALYFSVVRLGCFMGGCCYGIPSSVGVLYPEPLFTPVRGCRSYSPGENPRTRVFPVQLAESAAHLALFAALALRLRDLGRPDGLLLPLYLLAYSIVRFALDFARRASARPRRGPFSEAQWVSLVLALVCAAVLYHARAGAGG